MKAIVQMEIDIPDGYELAEPVMRTAKANDLVLFKGQVLTVGSATETLYPILKKKWKPEAGKVYMFSDKEYEVGTNDGFAGIFNKMYSNQFYTDRSGGSWKYCWPIPKEMIGE